MARLSKVPFETFQENVKRASALARLDGYLEDLFSGRAKQLFGGFANLPNDIMKIIGIDKILMEEMNEAVKRIKVRAEPIISGLDQEVIRKTMEDKIVPGAKRLIQVFEDLGLVAGRTLPEQALVLGVSAFEVYLKDITANIVARSSKIERKFIQEIRAGFNLSKLEVYKNDVKRTKGNIAADFVVMEPNRIRLILRRLVNWDELFATKEDERRFVQIVATRNLIIHKAGLVDSKFKRLTKYTGPVDELLTVTRTYSLESLSFISSLADAIDARLRLGR